MIILNEGRPRVIVDLVPIASAIVNVMLPGNYGGDALANLLAGDVNFSGKLSYTYPSCCNGYTTYDYKVCEVRSTTEGAYDYFANTNIQWPFGYGPQLHTELVMTTWKQIKPLSRQMMYLPLPLT